jgi:hypothetical protein
MPNYYCKEIIVESIVEVVENPYVQSTQINITEKALILFHGVLCSLCSYYEWYVCNLLSVSVICLFYTYEF